MNSILVKIALLSIVSLIGGTGFGVFISNKTNTAVTETTAPTQTTAAPTPTNSESGTTLAVLKVAASAEQIILLNAEVSEESVDIIIQQLNGTAAGRKVYLIITSPGGSVIAGAKLIAYMRSSAVQVDTVCTELCASMAFHIFEAGKKRYMTDKSFLMGHSASGGAQGTLPNMLSMLQALNLLVERMDASIAKRAGIPIEKFQVMMLRNLWIESVDAVNTGLADGIIHLTYKASPGELFDVDGELRKRNATKPTRRPGDVRTVIQDLRDVK